MDELMDYLDMVVPMLILEYRRNGIEDGAKELAIASYLEFIEIPSNVDSAVRTAIGEKTSSSSTLPSKLAEALAILSFQPGGIKFGRSRYAA